MSRSVERITREESLVEAAARIQEEENGALIVPGEPMLIVTSTDIVRMVAAGHDSSELTVADAATKVTTTVEPDQHIKDAASTMLKENTSHIPVMDGDEAIGMLTKTHITKNRAKL